MAESVFMRAAYLTPLDLAMFRCGKPARIVGALLVTPPDIRGCELPERLCFHVEWPDGVQDFVAVKDSKNYRVHGREEA